MQEGTASRLVDLATILPFDVWCELTFTMDGERRTFGPGGTWRIPSGLPHEIVAGQEGAVAIDAFAPIRDDWDFPMLQPQARFWPGPTTRPSE